MSTSRMALSKIPQKEHEISDNSDDERFLVLIEIEENKILDGSKKKSTNKATETHVNLLKTFVMKRKMGILEEILDADLPSLLKDFYFSMRTTNKETYSVQSQNCIRASLNRYFKKTRSMDIVSDKCFIKANEVFDGCKAKAKREGKGTRK